MRRKSLLLILCIAALIPTSVALADITSPLNGVNDFKGLLGVIISTLGSLLLGVATLMITVAGVLFLLSAGNQARLQRAKDALTYAIMGLIVGILADGIGTFLKGATTGADVGTVVTTLAGEVGNIMAGLGTVMFIVAGVFYVTSLGNPDRISTAKKTLWYAIVGIALGMLAKVIAEFFTGLST